MLPASKLIVLENTGHEPAFTKPDAVIGAIQELAP
jgi:pimeloyl-ACP methyl ester carboxylesterase